MSMSSGFACSDSSLNRMSVEHNICYKRSSLYLGLVREVQPSSLLSIVSPPLVNSPRVSHMTLDSCTLDWEVQKTVEYWKSQHGRTPPTLNTTQLASPQ
jgi:hypothetical protein